MAITARGSCALRGTPTGWVITKAIDIATRTDAGRALLSVANNCARSRNSPGRASCGANGTGNPRGRRLLLAGDVPGPPAASDARGGDLARPSATHQTESPTGR